MTAEKNHWVVDASVGVQLFVPEVYSGPAEEFFTPLGRNALFEVFVPDLFYAECANILWKHVRRGYPAPEAIQDLRQLKGLGLKRVPTAVLMPEALELSLKWDISAYDACYLALAEELKAPLVTADQKLIKRLKGSPISLKWIGDFSEK